MMFYLFFMKITNIIYKFSKSYDEETKSFYILLAFFLITIVLLVAISIYCYLIKHKAGWGGGGGLFGPLHPNFCSRAAVMFKLD